jgi:hypothetical protein
VTTHLLEPLLLLLLICVLASQLKPQRSPPQYMQKSILTDNELEFFWRLRRAMPDAYIFPQVAMSALIAPKSKDKSPRRLEQDLPKAGRLRHLHRWT